MMTGRCHTFLEREIRQRIYLQHITRQGEKLSYNHHKYGMNWQRLSRRIGIQKDT
ncbi:hypothetical protein QJS10_CPA10g00634 [Acorus calamus]|uniref:Uncharacterized protein n=1 Tax=Acorus calamus TaxID=4465 RepID=A0AAV9DYM5_ACOCL|nr:hypothetical protein QJS10_CPA10g00634 [Acorus calamus]